MARRHIFTLALIGLPLLANCRHRPDELPVVEPKPAGPVVADDVGGKSDGEDDQGGSGGSGGASGGTGPKIMGYQYWSRNSYGLLRGTYSDKQENQTVGRKRSTPETKIPGKRYTLEHYPVVVENYPKSQYGYALLEFRDEAPETNYWDRKVSVLMLGGFILPSKRLVAPVIGVHAEFNSISLSEDDSPEVAKSDLRAWVAGVHWRQKIWGTGDWFSAFYNGRFHFLNLGLPSWGYEYEIGAGTALASGLLRTELGIGYMGQVYNGERDTDDDEGTLKVKSNYKAWTATVTIWI